ncbi:AEC family transporter [Rhodanobacter sp. DHG33]|uniref:AEC family transporter n=1 Tax=Rhodanobacter sp. DHG33 TaxID=2775921 RepID=UPI0017865660|nr:AEC family transporter [Rhodanobacter sp. DHG33]MBD8899914.1 AEC family transporter [Rhodanobacter sp. DHG33]
MSALLLLFVCLALGAAVRRFAQPPAGIVHGLNWWVLNIALPALVLELIPEVKPDPRLWFPVAAIWLTFFGAWLLFAWLGRRLGWSRGRIGALVLVCGFANTSFMGYPMLQALHGQAGLALAVVADQLGCFPLLASAGVLVAGVYAGRTADPWQIARRILTFPAFLALLAGVAVGMLGGWPAALAGVLHSLGGTLTPLALFSVGLQFRLQGIRHQSGPVAFGLGWKLLLAPALCWLLGVATGTGGLVLTVGVLQAAMAPMVSAAIIADEHALDPELANTLLGVGIVLSLLTVPLLNLWLPAG